MYVVITTKGEIYLAQHLGTLFQSIGASDCDYLIRHLNGTEVRYHPNEILLRAGESSSFFGLVQEGSILITAEDLEGNATLLTRVGCGELFGEAFSVGGLPLGVSAQAGEESLVLWLDARRISFPCPEAYSAQRQLIENMLALLARKNIFLTQRIAHLSRRTLREKVLSYLAEECRRQGSCSIQIPFNRQELANYLAADRSALSSVLGKLRDEGMLTFYKNRFVLAQKIEEP